MVVCTANVLNELTFTGVGAAGICGLEVFKTEARRD